MWQVLQVLNRQNNFLSLYSVQSRVRVDSEEIKNIMSGLMSTLEKAEGR